jgi:hypothetical protein
MEQRAGEISCGRNELRRGRSLGEKMYIFGMCGRQTAPTSKKILVSRDGSVPDSCPSRRGQHGVADASSRLEKAPTVFEARWCEPIFDVGHQNTIEAVMGRAGVDALRTGSNLAFMWGRHVGIDDA